MRLNKKLAITIVAVSLLLGGCSTSGFVRVFNQPSGLALRNNPCNVVHVQTAVPLQPTYGWQPKQVTRTAGVPCVTGPPAGTKRVIVSPNGIRVDQQLYNGFSPGKNTNKYRRQIRETLGLPGGRR